MISNQLQTEESFNVIHLARKKDSSNNNNNNNNIEGRKVHKFAKITKLVSQIPYQKSVCGCSCGCCVVVS
jgi:hypothetical protein